MSKYLLYIAFAFSILTSLISCNKTDLFHGKWINASFDPSSYPFDPSADTYTEDIIEIEDDIIRTSFNSFDLSGTYITIDTFDIVDILKDATSSRFYILKKKKTDSATVLMAKYISKDKIRFEPILIKNGTLFTIEKILPLIQKLKQEPNNSYSHGEIFRSWNNYAELKKLPIIKYPMAESDYLTFLKKCSSYLEINSDSIKDNYSSRFNNDYKEIQQEVLISNNINPYTSLYALAYARSDFKTPEIINQQKFLIELFNKIDRKNTQKAKLSPIK